MRHLIRFIVDIDEDFTLEAISAGLKEIDPEFGLAEWDREIECAELVYGKDLYGEIELYRIDQEDADEEVEELVEEVKNATEGDKERVAGFLRHAKAMLVIRILWQKREAEATMNTLVPVWDWLFDAYQGLLQADGEGYYDARGQILVLSNPEAREQTTV